MKTCCGTCVKWRKITGRTGQCGEGRNCTKQERPVTNLGRPSHRGCIVNVELSPITTPIDDYCDRYEKKE